MQILWNLETLHGRQLVGSVGACVRLIQPVALYLFAVIEVGEFWRVTLVVLHVSQFAVGANAGVATSAPLTVRSIGRLAVVALAKRIATVVVPGTHAQTPHSTKDPTTLSVFTKPIPV